MFVKNALQYTSIVLKFELVIFGIKAREPELNASKRNGNNRFVKGKSNRKDTSYILINLVVLVLKIKKRENE